jgi:hypothetical protein
LPVAAVVLSIVAGCGSDDTVDPDKVEQGIKDDLSTSTNVTSASCPDDVKSEQGATFTCDVKFENGATGKAEVTQTGANSFTYELAKGSVRVPGATVEKEIQRSLAQQGIENATVNCPDNIVVKTDTTVTCEVAGSGGLAAGTVTFVFSSEEGTVDPNSVKTS